MSDKLSDIIPESWQEREDKREQERLSRQDRQLDLMQREIEMREQGVKIDDASARYTAFFDMPEHQRHFRVREVAITLAVKLGGNINTVLDHADKISHYINGGPQ